VQNVMGRPYWSIGKQMEAHTAETPSPIRCRNSRAPGCFLDTLCLLQPADQVRAELNLLIKVPLISTNLDLKNRLCFFIYRCRFINTKKKKEKAILFWYMGSIMHRTSFLSAQPAMSLSFYRNQSPRDVSYIYFELLDRSKKLIK
jgi:hypothetical protein